MPAPIAAAGIAAGAHLVGGLLTNSAQGKQDHKARKWQEHMYQVTRQDSLTDWHMQNAYNSPAAQMQRLKEAGLNPNLVYGNGADATAGQAPRSADSGHWSPSQRDFSFIGSGASSGLSAYFDSQIKQAQIDNLATQKTVMEQDALLKAAQTVGTLAGAGLTDVSRKQKSFDLQLAEELKQTTVDAARLGVTKQQADIQYTLDENERKAVQNTTSIAEAMERILNCALIKELATLRADKLNRIYSI